MAIKSNSRQRQSTLKKDLLQLALLLLEDETGLSSDTTYLYLANQTDEVVRRIGFTAFLAELTRPSSDKSGNFTAAESENNTVYRCTAALTATLPASPTKDGLIYSFQAEGFGIYISGTFADGATSKYVKPWDTATVHYNETQDNWWTI